VIYLTVPRRLFYCQKIGQLLQFWRKSGLESTKYSIFPNFFRGDPLTNLPMDGEGPLLCSCSYHHRPPQVRCCLLFVRGHLLYSLLKRLNLLHNQRSAMYVFWWNNGFECLGHTRPKMWITHSVWIAHKDDDEGHQMLQPISSYCLEKRDES